jgi:hypothetical protein
MSPLAVLPLLLIALTAIPTAKTTSSSSGGNNKISQPLYENPWKSQQKSNLK